jgi:hypothetical protein
MKMDRFQNKGVARRAFCKWLNRKGMDDGRFRNCWLVERETFAGPVTQSGMLSTHLKV